MQQLNEPHILKIADENIVNEDNYGYIDRQNLFKYKFDVEQMWTERS